MLAKIGWWTTFVVVVGLNVWGFMRFHAKRNPRITLLNNVADSIRSHDPVAFENEVDVDSVARSFYDQHILPQRMADKTAAIPGVRERETTAIARRLRRWVETGKIDDERPRLTLLCDFVGSAIDLRRESLDWISASPNVSVAEITLTDRFEMTARIELKLVRTQGIWRVAEVTNVEEVVSALRTKEQRRVRPEARRPLD